MMKVQDETKRNYVEVTQLSNNIRGNICLKRKIGDRESSVSVSSPELLFLSAVEQQRHGN